ncbi:aldehyde dehydrogenase family protein [Bradymonadaceae bacterium TMQ3]|nr:aldehyde dehydrogenase family protein [Bradymonadaceae bacterium TMQ3]TXC73193.1 aldehyde dehydrogenase family protein [Bradymonadales bacterium TMQ1]
MISSRANFIAGHWATPARSQNVLRRENPARTDEVVFETPWDTASVEAAVDAAHRALPAWDRLGVEGRLPYIERFRKALDARKEELAQAITAEMGKPLWESRGEAGALTAKIDIMSSEGLELTRQVHPPGLTGGSWHHRPLGPLAVLCPYNFPLHLPNGHIIPALLTGNTLIVKPSELAPLSMQLYFECAQEADFPPGVLNLVQGPGEVGAALCAHPRVSGVLFTGSFATAQRIRRATFDQPWKLLALEMGGKNTAIVLDDANLDQAAHEILLASCLTTGQRCSATSRVVALPSVIDDLQQRLVALLERVTTGDPTLEGNQAPFMGPLAGRKGFQDFVGAQHEDDHGTLIPVLEGGAHPDLDQGYFVRPSLWRASQLDPEGDHQSEELFGPDIVLYEASDESGAARIANATDYGLAMSVFTADPERFQNLSYALDCGILNLNRSTVGASSRLPFGGIKKSGNHRPAAILAPLYCTYPQARLEQPAEFSPAPPQSGPLSLLKPA